MPDAHRPLSFVLSDSSPTRTGAVLHYSPLHCLRPPSMCMNTASELCLARREPRGPGAAALPQDHVWLWGWHGSLPRLWPSGDVRQHQQHPKCLHPATKYQCCLSHWRGLGSGVHPGGCFLACPHAVQVRFLRLDGLHGPRHLPPPPAHRCWSRCGARHRCCWSSARGVRGCTRHHRRAPGRGGERLPGGHQRVEKRRQR